MAMDKEKLLAYFQAHYLSRQEVLFKLPLNIPIENFWPELLNRRKAKAQLLPLFNAAGMPYWYVLTDRMIAASERLCEEAICQDSSFDPYRAGMTSAMTEEMFFTSFVEGAQIPLQEAMDFLQRGTEPENIQEQLIWNNRRAWAEMTATLYRPLDEGFVRSLAFMLTEEMDNCADDYRQTDQHTIAAMNNEEYIVPPACSIPDRMREYYDFLQKPDVHPLIKSAAAQAFLLVTRPFLEGNERLSRMMSSAVLLRCGYDFFRDISISSIIARESYRYYKCMCEIIRGENGGDLTYFMQYYLELLVRALDARKERQRRREQEAMEREQEKIQQEREMARQPLAHSVPTDQSVLTDQSVQTGTEDIGNAPSRPKSPASVEDEPTGAVETDTSSLDPEFVDTKPDTVSSIDTADGHQTIDDFNLQMAQLETVSSIENADGRQTIDAFKFQMTKLDSSKSENRRMIASTIRSIMAQGINRFTRQDWMAMSGMDWKNTRDACDYMISHDMIHNILNKRGSAIYVFTVTADMPSPKALTQETAVSERMENSSPRPVTEACLRRIREIASGRTPSRGKLVSEILLQLIDQGISSFTVNDIAKSFDMSKSKATEWIQTAFRLGLLVRMELKSSSLRFIYYFNPNPIPVIRSEGMSCSQRRILTILYSSFKDHYFTVQEAAAVCCLKKEAFKAYLNSFAQRGIIVVNKQSGRFGHYAITTTPLEHPECFELEKASHSSPSFAASIPMAAASA